MRTTGILILLFALLPLSTFAADPAPPATKTGPDTVVVTQGTAKVTLADIDAFMQRMPPEDRAGFIDSPKRIQSMLLNLLLDQQLANEARKAGLEKDPMVQREIQLATNRALADARRNQFRANLKLPDFDELAQEEYLAHKDQYVVPGSIDVEHILISTSSHSDKDAKTLADDVRRQAIAKPGDFQALVAKYSDDPSKATNHGLIKDAGSSQYDPAFAAAAKALTKTGQISPVVKSMFGYHVLKLVSRTDAKQKPFAEVKGAIAAKLKADWIKKQVQDHIDQLRNNALDADPDVVASLRTRYGSVPAAPDESPADKTAVAPQH
ncbi:MAG: peptidylprolyl isomerase [Lysobacterales bacterium]